MVPLTPVLRLCPALPKVPDCSGNSEWVDMIVTETLREGMKMWLDLQQKLELEQAEMGGGAQEEKHTVSAANRDMEDVSHNSRLPDMLGQCQRNHQLRTREEAETG